jgi:FAD/FMN-containing dehydrogenase
MATLPTTIPISDLRRAVRGRILSPQDTEYDRARMVLLGTFDPHPAAIVRATDAGDVAAFVNFVRESGTPFAVRSGGHSGAGHSTVDDGVVLDLRELGGHDLDLDTRTVWADAGLTAGALTTALGEHGLAVGFGDTGSVGLGGLTLGGGVGYLVRKFGLTIDALLAAEMVTADGEIRHVDAETDPDLFWAIRGGGGNFGVATRFRYRLAEVPSVVGGMLILPATADVITGFMEAAAAAPEELSAIANVMPAPPMPFLPEEAHGKLVVFAMLCFAGVAEAGERAMAPFRSLGTLLADLVKPMPYPEIYPPEDESYRPKAIARTLFMDRFDPGLAEAIMDRLETSDATLRAAQLRVLGGAMARVPSDATAFAHRSRPIMANVAAFFEGPDDFAEREAWVLDLAATLRQGDAAGYVNFLADEGPDAVRAAYPGATWDRLCELKARYDPTNLFSRNQNIPPATGR